MLIVLFETEQLKFLGSIEQIELKTDKAKKGWNSEFKKKLIYTNFSGSHIKNHMPILEISRLTGVAKIEKILKPRKKQAYCTTWVIPSKIYSEVATVMNQPR